MIISKRKLAGLKGARTKHQNFIDYRRREKEALEKYLVVVKEMINSGVLRNSSGRNHSHVYCVPIWTGGSKMGLVKTIEKHITYAQLDINEHQAKLDVVNEKIQDAERRMLNEIHS